MSGIHRFLTRRDRNHKLNKQSKEEASHILSRPLFHGFFKPETPLEDNHEHEKKVKALIQRIKKLGITALQEEHISYALQTTHGDAEKAFSLLLLLEDSIEGIIRTYTPNTKLLGAENRQGVTCYLDALLFAMFARLDCFEAILYNTFNDEPRRKLAILLRLWVNLLRSGRLITTDLTKHLQDALSECGWEDAANLRQQDASEAFTFITEKLELPLLTLKMDIYHTGKEDENDDHKFVNERLLEVAIPPAPADGHSLTLEDCLEAYFNNMIEVKRLRERRNTTSSARSVDSLSICKGSSAHVETVELETSPTPTLSPTQTNAPRVEKSSGWASYHEFAETLETSRTPGRRDSLVRERFFPDSSDDTNPENVNLEKEGTSTERGTNTDTRPRRGTYKKEVMMPAWQFFRLIPWYTDNTPTNDAQVAAHFSTKRPILGMCLKRYSFLPDGRAIRLNTHIDIPTEIGLPHFIQDDNLDSNAPIYGNFKLSLQALVCHRGNSVDSGHYISIVRGTSPNGGIPINGSTPEPSKHWMRFDDLAAERVTLVDIDHALKTESPYLLFYQILPISEDPSATNTPNPPSSRASDGSTLADQAEFSSEEFASDRPSVEVTAPCDTSRQTLTNPARRPSIAFSETSNPAGLHPRSIPSSSPRLVSMEEEWTKRTPSRPGSRPARSNPGSRAGSQTGENRISATISRFAERLSRDKFTSDAEDESGLEIDDTLDDMKLGPGALENREKRGRGRTKDHERNQGKSKEKHKKLDRECVVM